MYYIKVGSILIGFLYLAGKAKDRSGKKYSLQNVCQYNIYVLDRSTPVRLAICTNYIRELRIKKNSILNNQT